MSHLPSFEWYLAIRPADARGADADTAPAHCRPGALEHPRRLLRPKVTACPEHSVGQDQQVIQDLVALQREEHGADEKSAQAQQARFVDVVVQPGLIAVR